MMAMMCYLQLSLLCIPAEVIIGDALRMDFRRSMHTPAHYLGGWDDRLAARNARQSAVTAEIKPVPARPILDIQLDLFDGVA